MTGGSWRPVLLVAVGVLVVATIALLGAPDRDAAPPTSSTAPDSERPLGSELSLVCDTQIGANAEAVWVENQWSCAGATNGVWRVAPLDLGLACPLGPPRSITAAGIDCATD